MSLPPEFDPDDENADDDAMCRLALALLACFVFFGGVMLFLLFRL